MKGKITRREILETAVVFGGGVVSGLLFNYLFSRDRKNNPGSFKPMFRVMIYSDDWLKANYTEKEIAQVKKLCGNTNGFTEFCYFYPQGSSVGIYRKGKLIQEDFKQSDSYRFIFQRETGLVPYSFVLTQGRKSPEEIVARTDFKIDSELEVLVTDPEEEGVGPKVEFVYFEKNVPGQVKILGSNGVLYHIHGPEAVCRGVNSELFKEYFLNRGKYIQNNHKGLDAFGRFKQEKGIR